MCDIFLFVVQYSLIYVLSEPGTSDRAPVLWKAVSLQSSWNDEPVQSNIYIYIFN